MRIASLLIASVFASLSSSIRAADLDFSNATVVVRDGDRPAAEKIAPTVLTEEIARRTGVTWNVTDRWPARGDAVIALSVMATANTILLEAGLGYLGIGVPPPAPSWGSMIADGQDYFVSAPLIVITPGLAIIVTVLAFNLLGQGLQEVLKPHERR